MADQPADNQAPADKKADYTTKTGVDVVKARTLAARIVWGLCLVFALVLAAAALLIALKANEENSLVDFVLGFADGVDLGFFALTDPIKEFTGENAEIKTALLSYGLGAIFWLVLGKVLESVIKP